MVILLQVYTCDLHTYFPYSPRNYYYFFANGISFRKYEAVYISFCL